MGRIENEQMSYVEASFIFCLVWHPKLLLEECWCTSHLSSFYSRSMFFTKLHLEVKIENQRDRKKRKEEKRHLHLCKALRNMKGVLRKNMMAIISSNCNLKHFALFGQKLSLLSRSSVYLFLFMLFLVNYCLFISYNAQAIDVVN